MKKNKIKFLTFLFLLFVFSAYSVYAQDYFVLRGSGSRMARIGDFLKFIADYLYWILLSGAAIAIVIGSGMFLFSGGEPGKVATGKKMVIYALVSVLVATFAWALVNFVYNFFR